MTNLSNAAAARRVSFENGFSELSASEWLGIWGLMHANARSATRSLYEELAANGEAGADFALAKQMRRWKAREDTQTLRRVIEWDAENGAFTSAEWELIRVLLNRADSEESDADCATRIFGRVLNETLKRPIQVLSMKRDALWVAPSGREFFLRIPKAKGQVSERPESWQITSELAEAIQAYSRRPEIHALQRRFDRLIVMPSVHEQELDWMEHGQVSAGFAKERLQDWAKKQAIISPRTNEDVNLSPYRIRHTGATTMALQGVPRDEIQEVLEHDSPYSADAYIQAVGSDLMPALERATDRGVGKVFAELHHVYFFKGAIVDTVGRRPIHLPIVVDSVAQPAVVGSCGKSGACKKHPFWACYNGCPMFLAWRDGPHEKSLEFVESELKRWSEVEGGKERSKLGKDFDRVGAAIHEVIDQIKQSRDSGGR
ncbi:MAG: tyrosine-type recombinase/integrase [Silanimonas sp.]|nr:tyrosine-type recombinase/integrase [Silanimonas sp.]